MKLREMFQVVGECTMNYDPRSLSMDLCPTRMVWKSNEFTAEEIVAKFATIQKAAPTWTFRVEKLPK